MFGTPLDLVFHLYILCCIIANQVFPNFELRCVERIKYKPDFEGLIFKQINKLLIFCKDYTWK